MLPLCWNIKNHLVIVDDNLSQSLVIIVDIVPVVCWQKIVSTVCVEEMCIVCRCVPVQVIEDVDDEDAVAVRQDIRNETHPVTHKRVVCQKSRATRARTANEVR